MKRWTVGDLEPPLSGTALDLRTPVDLTATASATANVQRDDGTVISRAVTLGDQTTSKGSWSMPWQTGDLSIAGGYEAELKVMWPGTRPQTFGPEKFQVRPSLSS